MRLFDWTASIHHPRHPRIRLLLHDLTDTFLTLLSNLKLQNRNFFTETAPKMDEEEPLTSIVCTAHVASSVRLSPHGHYTRQHKLTDNDKTLSSILSTAYEKEPDCEPSLILLSTDSKAAWAQYTLESVTQPEVLESFTTPFAGMTVESVARYIYENGSGTIVNTRYVLIADERTAKDSTLLLVEIDFDNPEVLERVRIAGDYANAEAVTLTVKGGGMEELQSLVDGDGVYRGGDE